VDAPTDAPAQATTAPEEPAEPEPVDAPVGVEPELVEPATPIEADTPIEPATPTEATTPDEPAPPVEAEPLPGGDRPDRSTRRAAERAESSSTEDVVPGAHLVPDLVLDAPAEPDQFAGYAEQATEDGADDAVPAPPAEEEEASSPASRSPLSLAADARYAATGKRKTAAARVILRPGTGVYTVNGRALEAFFPRPTLQRTARGPLETAGYQETMDVVARIHGGGVSAQAGALRHGVARALVDADPALRGELKREGFLTRDARAKERKKAGLKKARKRPQFSKR